MMRFSEEIPMIHFGRRLSGWVINLGHQSQMASDNSTKPALSRSSVHFTSSFYCNELQ